MAITEAKKVAIIHQILKIPGIGPVKFWKDFNKTKDLEITYKNFIKHLDTNNIDTTINEIENYAKSGINCLSFWQSNFPKQLKRLHDMPPILWTKGHVEFLQHPQIAIVGGRNASFHGIKFAQTLSEELSTYGFTIVSGLARGIDKAAHQGALQKATIAVLAGGVDKLYPKENTSLYEEICKNHLVISEMPPGVEPTAELFPRRNRIIAALSNGVCVIEAALKSGSLLTAKYGLDIGLPIFSCPGHPYDPRTKGSNKLIKDGAFLLDNTFDVIEQLPIASISSKQNPPVFSPAAHHKASDTLPQAIINFLSHTPVKVEDLLKHLEQYPTEVVLIALSELELTQAIHRPSSNLITLG